MEYDILGRRLNLGAPFYNIVLGRAKPPVRRLRRSELNAELKALIAFRRRREALFGTDLFADPVWDILLDLFLASNEHRHVSISSLCIASATPPTTALRWIRTLEKRGFLQRENDPNDSRRVFISLVPDVEDKMKQLLYQRFDIDNAEDQCSCLSYNKAEAAHR